MAFEGLRDKLKEQWADLSAKIQESSAFNTLRETFESQTPPVQKAIIGVGCALAVLFVLSFPYGYLSQSDEYMTIFEENRVLIQGLLRASRAAKEPSPLPADGSSDSIKSRVDNILRENQLIPEQIGEMQPLPDSPAKDLAPPAVRQAGLTVQLKKLNLRQVVAVNVAFQNMGLGIKLIGLDIVQSADQTHYYDVVARIVAFSLPQITFDSDPSAGNARSGRGRAGGGSPPPPKRTPPPPSDSEDDTASDMPPPPPDMEESE